MQKEIYCLPVRRLSTSQLIPSGKKEEIIRKRKLQVGKELMLISGGEVVKEVSSLAPKHNASGGELLESIKESITGCFEPASRQIFAGIVDFVYYAGKITHAEYQRYRDWLDITQKNVESENIFHDVYERIYSGFAYIDRQGTKKYYYNAVKASSLQRRNELMQNKNIVTPLFEKRYCFNRTSEFAVVIEDFKKQLQDVFDKNYLSILQYIYYDLPSEIDKERFQFVYNEAKREKKNLLAETLNYYGVLWQIW